MPTKDLAITENIVSADSAAAEAEWAGWVARDPQAPVTRSKLDAVFKGLILLRDFCLQMNQRNASRNKHIAAITKRLDETEYRLLTCESDFGSRLRTLECRPRLLYRGVYRDDQHYEPGDAVTYGGSTWIAHEATQARPGDGATPWQLAVKAGRDGRDAR
jgi:hypothetical protein